MVLNVTDEVINGSPKYNITDNGDGTKNITLANEVVQSGTPLNRNLFNKIENVLSYQNLNEEVNENITSGNVEANSSDFNTLDNDQTIAGGLNINYNVGNKSNAILLNVYNRDDGSLYVGNSMQSYISPRKWDDGIYGWKGIMNKQTAVSNNEYIRCLTTYNSFCNFVFDFKGQANFTLNIKTLLMSSEAMDIQTSNDNINWTTDYTLRSSGGSVTYEKNWDFENKRYIRLHCWRNSSQGSDDIRLYWLNFTNVQIIDKQVNYTTSGISIPINNQRLLMQSSNSMFSNNTLNNYAIDTLLQPSKFYELVYNESQNKFIAQEVRN